MTISITQNSVSNTVRGHTVKFNITNLGKSESLYNSGMKPLAFSKAASSSSGTGWRRSGEQVRYYCNNSTSSSNSSGTGNTSSANTAAAAATPSKSARSRAAAGGGGAALHTLTFTHTFTHSDDTVYFAHSMPYTYSDLQSSLEALQRSGGDAPGSAVRMRRTTLCRTLAGNEVPLITVTAPIKYAAELRRRPAIVLTGRVHPGESNGSYIMEGVLRFITSPHPTAAALRERFVIKVSYDTPAHRPLYICCIQFSYNEQSCAAV
jgi:cytosolic carboxypeptidase protein 2/3